MKKLLALLLVAIMVLSLVACGSDSSDAKDTEDTTAEQTTNKKPSGNSSSSKDEEKETIVGIWVNEDIDIAYEFTKKGEFICTELYAGSTDEGEYEFEDDTLVIIEGDMEMEMGAKLKGDKLTLSYDGEKIVLEKVDSLDDYLDSSDSDGSIEGSWTGEINMAGLFNMILSALSPDEDALDFLEIDELNFIYTYDFDDDGTYTVSLDADALADEIDDYIADMLDAYADYFDYLIDDNDLDISVDEYLEEYMMTDWDELEETLEASFDIDSLAGQSSADGEYEIDGDELYLSAENATYYFEIDGDELIFYDFAGDIDLGEMEDVYDLVFPMVFERD